MCMRTHFGRRSSHTCSEISKMHQPRACSRYIKFADHAQPFSHALGPCGWARAACGGDVPCCMKPLKACADFLHISSTASCTSHHAMYARTVPAICKTCTCTRARHPGRSPTCQTCTGPGLAGNMQNNMHSFGNLEDMFIQHADNGVPCNDMCKHTA
jgi:hypothetical protein